MWNPSPTSHLQTELARPFTWHRGPTGGGPFCSTATFAAGAAGEVYRGFVVPEMPDVTKTKHKKQFS